jgi:hypothetical protein
MQLANPITLLVMLILLGVAFLVYQGWRDWSGRLHDPYEQWWKKLLTSVGLSLVSLAALLFIGYSGHNAIIGGDQGGTATTIPLIKIGNSLSFFGVIMGLGGKGRQRWVAVGAGCLTLFLWLWQGVSL